MGTRSDIIVHRGDGKWHRIYCHWDGYLENNGRILFDHYTSQSKADALVALGDLSSLGPELGSKHSFEWRDKLHKKYGSKAPETVEYKRFEATCLVYGRDRGERDVVGTVSDTLAGCWPDNETWTEFTYVWDDGKWWVGDSNEGSQTLIDLGDALLGKKTLRPAVKAFGATIGQHNASSPEKGHSWTWKQ